MAFGVLASVEACQPLPVPPEAPRPVPRWLGLDFARSQCADAGPERCFDARDDDCDGYIDEGCGLGTGPLQFVLAWDVSDFDLDLEVRDPRGELVPLGRISSSGLTREHDCPSEEWLCAGQNVENVYLVWGEPERGLYEVSIRRRSGAEQATAVTLTLGLRVEGETYISRVVLEADHEPRFELTL